MMEQIYLRMYRQGEIGSNFMDKQKLTENIGYLQNSIALLREHGFITPLLILTYSLIDILSWLDRSEDHDDVTRTDFQKWTDFYIRPENNLGCTSIDLYGARCSLVHSLSSESMLSRKKEANRVFYVWGNFKEETLLEMIKETGSDERIIPLRIKNLITEINRGINEFIDSKGNNEVILQRTNKFFIVKKSNEQLL